MNFADPLGLKICYKGTPSQVTELRKGTEDATGTTITLDRDNCVESYKTNGEKGFEEIQARFGALKASSNTVDVSFAAPDAFESEFDGKAAYILRSDYNGGTWYRSGNCLSCNLFGGTEPQPTTIGALVAHELLGHGYAIVSHGIPQGQREAVRIENQYHSAHGQPRRCN